VKIRYPTTAEADAAAIRCILPVDDEDLDGLREEFPTLPLVNEGSERLTLTLDLDTGAIRGWSHGAGRVHLKVRDQGAYELLDRAGAVIGGIDGYVPGCVPGEDGDYFVAEVEADGTVKGWRPHARDVVAAFWGER
jgi:hypothetical protein